MSKKYQIKSAVKLILGSSWFIIIPFTIIFSYLTIFPLIDTFNELKSSKVVSKEQSNIKKGEVKQKEENKTENNNNINRKTGREDINYFISIATFLLVILGIFSTPSQNKKFIFRIFMFLAYPYKKKKLKKKLINNHSEILLPFRPEKPLLMDDVFITLSAIRNSRDSLACEEDNEQNENIDKILTHVKKFVIVGVPGSGKSLLCKNLVYRYSKNNLPMAINNAIPALIEVHKLTRLEDIYIEIYKFLGIAGFNNNFIDSLLERGKLLIMFDGFDEIRKEDKKWIVLGINDFIRKNDKCQYIITCRISVYDGEFDAIVDRKYKLLDFDEKQIKQYLMAWGKNNKNKVEDLISTLHERANIKKLAGNPLQLAIIAYLVVDMNESLPYSRGEFYNLVTKYLLGNPQKCVTTNTDFENGIEALKQIALFMHKSKESNIKEIDKFTLIEIIDKTLGYQRKESEDFFSKVIKPSNIIHEINKKTSSYKFFHDSFREYLVALCYLNKPNDLLFEFRNNKNNWREVVKFWCCLTKGDITSFIFDTYNTDPLLTLDCIAEATIIDTEKFISIIDKYLNFETILESEIDSVTKSLGTIVSNKVNPYVKNKLGEVIFSDLREKILNPTSTFVLKTAANTLSFSAIVDSAKVLVENYEKDDSIFKALENMGDLAVPFLNKIAKSGESKAVYCLSKIGTEEALLCLIDLLWITNKNKSEISTLSAWLLSTEESIKNIEKIASKEKPDDKNNNFESLDFVWEPFDDGNKNFTYQIVNRIAYLINQSNPPKLLPGFFEMDKRISIPLSLENGIVEEVGKYKNFENLISSSGNLFLPLQYTNEKIRNYLITIASENPIPSMEMWINLNKKDGNKDYYEFKYNTEHFISMSLIFLLVPGLILSFYGITEKAIPYHNLLYFLFVISILHFCVSSMFQIKIKFPFDYNNKSSKNKFKTKKYKFSSICKILLYIYILAYIVNKSYSKILCISEIQGYLLITIAIIVASDFILWGKNREYQSFNPLKRLLDINTKQ